MRGFPKKVATGKDFYNCLSGVQSGEFAASDLKNVIAAVEEREYITVPVLNISEDRKTIVINPCAEAQAGAQIKSGAAATIKEARRERAEAVLAAFQMLAEAVFDKLEDLFSALASVPMPISEDGDTDDGGASGMEEEELMILTLSEAMEEGQTALKILAETSPYDVLGISADDLNSIKGVLKNYE